MRPTLRVVLVHDWLTGMRGGEKVLEVAVPALADGRRFTRFCTSPAPSAAAIENRPIGTSFLQMLPRRPSATIATRCR